MLITPRLYLPLTSGLLAALLTITSVSNAAAESTSPSKETQPQETTEHAFSDADTNQDDRLSRDEYTTLGYARGSFDEADLDTDSHLDRSEFVKASSISERMKAAAFIDDSWITTKIKTALVKESGLSGLGIKVGTKDGVVQLSGWVETAEQSRLAGSIASQVKGVKAVENDIIIQEHS